MGIQCTMVLKLHGCVCAHTIHSHINFAHHSSWLKGVRRAMQSGVVEKAIRIGDHKLHVSMLVTPLISP